jgi:hypothetical protein
MPYIEIMKFCQNHFSFMYVIHHCSSTTWLDLIHYLAAPSLRDIAHDGCLCTLYNIAAAENSISSQLGSSCQGNRYCTEQVGSTARPSRTKSHLPGHSLPAARQPSCWDSPLAFGLIGSAYRLQ